MQVQARLRHYRASARKVRLVTDMVKGMDVARAIETLRFTQKKSAAAVMKLLQSAVANADQQGTVDVDALYVHNAYVDEGPTLRRFQPRAMGRANRIRKRTSHITVILDDER
ncbi:MAG: 50S ribosomal protein L22 [Deltaproteobacteria bacterium]|nr:50S ribosomal protein L22 [Candidatus Anaeroferrophillus wilburensis]MBN2889525.1 50S ribosomal protein L22 [Deltaproteobacteria bacterium]